MPLDDKKGRRLIDRGVRALRRAGLSSDFSASGHDAHGPYIVVRDSPEAREVLQPVRESGLRVEWGERWMSHTEGFHRTGPTAGGLTDER